MLIPLIDYFYNPGSIASTQLVFSVLLTIIFSIVAGVVLAYAAISTIYLAANTLGDDLPELKDYSTDNFGGAFFGADYGKKTKNVKHL